MDTNASYVLVKRHSGMAMDVYDLATADGAGISQYARNDGALAGERALGVERLDLLLRRGQIGAAPVAAAVGEHVRDCPRSAPRVALDDAEHLRRTRRGGEPAELEADVPLVAPRGQVQVGSPCQRFSARTGAHRLVVSLHTDEGVTTGAVIRILIGIAVLRRQLCALHSATECGGSKSRRTDRVVEVSGGLPEDGRPWASDPATTAVGD
ncbi:hypothetical protein ACFOWZ_16540 [Lentzea rhizosphaerae]|uniref:Uncharacterized protein n=1 Tax=Lentzea rhizosphaerae TaxID=2041025 RepID=A0ABV8BVB9_9PSEU